MSTASTGSVLEGGMRLALLDIEMSETTQERHRCRNPRCGKPFAVVYRRCLEDVLIPLPMACPSCGRWGVVMVTSGAVREDRGTWVLPLGHAVVPHQTPSDLRDPHA